MLSSHYAGTQHQNALSSLTPQSQHSHFTQNQHTISTLLPTPPSSPPTIGLQPVESTISLLESLVAFYHQERMWVYRTRAQLEMGLMQRVELANTSASASGENNNEEGGADGQGNTPNRNTSSNSTSTENGDTSSPSPPTKWLKRKKAFGLRLEGLSTARGVVPSAARGGITKHRARQSSNLNPASISQAGSSSNLNASPANAHPTMATPHHTMTANSVSFYPPTAGTATLTSPYLLHPPFSFPTRNIPTSSHPLPPSSSSEYTTHPASQNSHAHPLQSSSYVLPPSQAMESQIPSTSPTLGSSGRDRSVQILEMFESMMQARMESCERVTRLVRGANNPGRSTGVEGAMGGRVVGGPLIAGMRYPVGGAVGGPGIGFNGQVIGPTVSSDMGMSGIVESGAGGPNVAMETMSATISGTNVGGPVAGYADAGDVYTPDMMQPNQTSLQGGQGFPMEVNMT